MEDYLEVAVVEEAGEVCVPEKVAQNWLLLVGVESSAWLLVNGGPFSTGSHLE